MGTVDVYWFVTSCFSELWALFSDNALCSRLYIIIIIIIIIIIKKKERNNQTNNECLPKFVQTDNASSSIKTAIWKGAARASRQGAPGRQVTLSSMKAL